MVAICVIYNDRILVWKFKNVYKNTFERLDPQITT